MPEVWLRNAQRFECLPNRHELPECAGGEEGGEGGRRVKRSLKSQQILLNLGKTGGQMGQRFATEMSEAVTPQNWS